MPPFVQNYRDSHLREHAAEPELTVTEYPADARNRIVELVFSYPPPGRSCRRCSRTCARVWRRQRSTSATVRARRRRPRCCLPIWPSASRISRGDSRTPVYSALCQGVANSKSMAQSWQLLCDEAGLSCRTVSGLRGGEAYWWNIVTLDGVSCHVDVLRDLLDGSTLRCGMMRTWRAAITGTPKTSRPAPHLPPRGRRTGSPAPTEDQPASEDPAEDPAETPEAQPTEPETPKAPPRGRFPLSGGNVPKGQRGRDAGAQRLRGCCGFV